MQAREKIAIQKLIAQGVAEDIVMKSYAIGKKELKRILENQLGTRKLTVEDEETIKLMHQQGKSIKEIAGKLRVSRESVAKRLRKYPDYVNPIISEDLERMIVRLYKKGHSVKQIEEMTGISCPSIYVRLRKYHAIKNPSSGFSHVKKEEIEQIIQKYKEGKSKTEIAREFNRHTATIYRIINKHMRKNE